MNGTKQLFTYAVLWHPTEKQIEDGQQSRIVVEPTNVLAADEKSAALHAARALTDEDAETIGQLDVIVRPF